LIELGLSLVLAVFNLSLLEMLENHIAGGMTFNVPTLLSGTYEAKDVDKSDSVEFSLDEVCSHYSVFSV